MAKRVVGVLVAVALSAPAGVAAQELGESSVFIRDRFVSAPTPGTALYGRGAFIDRKQTYRVMGITEREALAHSGDPDGDAFSGKHLQGDMANRWAHAAVVKSASAVFAQAGFGKLASALLGAAVGLPKEYLIDARPSSSDMVIADYPLFHFGSRQAGETRASLSLFGDGAWYFSLEKTF